MDKDDFLDAGMDESHGTHDARLMSDVEGSVGELVAFSILQWFLYRFYCLQCEVRRTLERRALQRGGRFGAVKLGGYTRDRWSFGILHLKMWIRNRRTRNLSDEIEYSMVKWVLAAVSGIGHYHRRAEELVLQNACSYRKLGYIRPLTLGWHSIHTSPAARAL